MLRRRKDDIQDGQPLFKLPQRHVVVISCQFDYAERTFYTALENRAEVIIQKILKCSKSGKYMSFFVLLLRLRQGSLPSRNAHSLSDVRSSQACDHPALVLQDYNNAVHAEVARPRLAAGNSTSVEDLEEPAVKCKLCLSEFV